MQPLATVSFSDVIGQAPHDIAWWQMCIRALIVFVMLLVLIQLGGTRAFGKISAFDIVIGVLLGSTLSRAINGSAPFGASLAAGAALVLLHWIAGRVAFHSHTAGRLIKGHAVQLVADGQLLDDALKRYNITEHDLEAALRVKVKSGDLAKLKDAYLERSGEISVIPYD
jgi:uncharacterized membrane protein YcaP (DUF421 family)